MFPRPVWIEINLSAIRHNLRYIRQLLRWRTKIGAVLKANAYGHGAAQIARIAIEEGVSYICVSSLEEAEQLRRAGIVAPILVFSYVDRYYLPYAAEYNIEVSLVNLEQVGDISRVQDELRIPLKIHVNIDTGMGRLGLSPDEVEMSMTQLGTFKNVEVVGMYTHFARAEEDVETNQQQYQTFKKIVDSLKEKNLCPRIVHMANSAALMRFPEAHFDMVRPGIAIYGYDPREVPNENLKPALQIKARPVRIERIPAGKGISYGHEYVTERETTIVTVPIGYSDGLPRALKGKWHVLIHGKKFPVVGRITMDHIMVDVGDEPVSYYDEVVILGKQGKEELWAYDMAKAVGTNSYEILSRFSERIPRIHFEEAD